MCPHRAPTFLSGLQVNFFLGSPNAVLKWPPPPPSVSILSRPPAACTTLSPRHGRGAEVWGMEWRSCIYGLEQGAMCVNEPPIMRETAWDEKQRGLRL